MSFGLVLLATILLVVGLLSDDGITLIYLSIGASATAAVVLFLAFRMARPKGGTGAEEPAPLPEDLRPTDVDEAPAVETVPPSPPAPPTVPVPAAAPTEDDWADDTDWEVDDEEVVDFPIADYDDLTVAEILPLLPQLYSDELDIVYEREQSGKARATILAELDKLKETGTEADALEQGATAAPAAPAAPAPAAAPPVATPSSSLLDDDDEFDAAFFPIADYDDLSVSQIVPLLPQLEEDELRDVREREVAGANRATLVAEIDRYLSGELETFTWQDDAPADEPAPVVVDPEVARLPIADYPQLIVSEVVSQLDGLTPAQLEQVLEFEKARDNRYGIVADIERRLDEAAPAAAARPRKATKKRTAKKRTATKSTTRKSTAKKATAKKATAKKSTSKKATAKKATTRKSTAKKTSTKKAAAKKATSKKATKRSTKSTKKSTAARFPIANYDELSVAAIRPQLTDLTDAQLRQVRDREQTGAGRKTILNDIDKRLT